MTDLSERIEERMQELGMTGPDGSPNVSALEGRVGDVAYSTLSNLVRGRTNNPEADTVRKVARALGTTTDWLLGGDDFDRRAYQQGKEAVASEVEEAIQRAMKREPADTAPTETEPATSPDEEEGEGPDDGGAAGGNGRPVNDQP